MISTLSKQGGRRYPQMGSTGLVFHGWLPSVGGSVTPPTPTTPLVGDPYKDYQSFEVDTRILDQERLIEYNNNAIAAFMAAIGTRH